MNRKVLNVSLVATLASGISLGCGTTGERKPYLQDPLLISKKPVEARAQDARPILLAQAEPTPPMSPGVSLAAAPRPVESGNPPAAMATSEPLSGVPAQTISTYK